MFEYFRIQASFGWSINVYTSKHTFLSFFLSSFFFSFLTSNTNSSVRCHVDSLWTTEEQKSLARGVFDTFATHADLLHDVTDTDLRAQSDDTHGRVLATFNRFLTNEIKNWAKKSVVVVVLFVSLFLFCFVVALFVCYFHSHRWDSRCFSLVLQNTPGCPISFCFFSPYW